METGAVIALGDPQEVITHPQVIASYLGGSDLAIHRSGTKGNPRRATVPAGKAS
jgi:hypothetical protein